MRSVAEDDEQQSWWDLPAHAPNRAKLRPPRVRPGHVPRDSLLELLESHRGVVVATAPPGFGKTTLLGQWAAADHRPFAWVTLDAADNDPVVLWSYIELAIRSLRSETGIDRHSSRPSRRSSGRSSGRASDRSSGRDQPPDLGIVVPQLVAYLASLESEVVLVLDDFHTITNPLCLATLEAFVEQQPENATVALAARAGPQLPLGELRVSTELIELRPANLAFTLEESETFLNDGLGLGLGGAAIRTLWHRTEGWPAGLYLAYLSLREAPDADAFVEEFRGSSRRVVDYLTEVIVDAQDERTRDFLLGSSILDRMSGPLCDAVLETEGSAKLLRRLERANLFIVGLDDHREWYRYHRLLLELLRAELGHRQPERMRGLHRRAAGWFRDAGDTGQAVVHALRAGEREMAIGAVSENYLRTLEWGGVATIESWLGAFPRADIAADPRLAVVDAWVMSFQGRYAEADIALANAARADYRGPLPDGAGSVDASAALVRASAPRGNVAEMLGAARAAFALESDGRSMWRVTTHVQLGWALALSGAFREADVLLKRAAIEAAMTEQWLNALGARCLLAWTSLYQDRVIEAEGWAADAVDVVERHGLAEASAAQWAYATLGAVRAARGRLDDANMLLSRSIERLRAATPPILLVDALLAFAPVAHSRGRSAEARAILDEARGIVEACEDAGIVRGRLERVTKMLNAPGRRASGNGSLTRRELDVLRLLEQGMSKREIARTLYLSFNTVHSHTKSIYRKLGAVTRDQAMRIARERGVLGDSSVSLR